jgi:lysyl-tRNA synthetase, class II
MAAEEMSDPTPRVEDEAAQHSKLAEEKALRYAKLAALEAAGTNPYPHRYDRSATLAEIRAEHGTLVAGSETEVRVSVAGRMMLRRDTGKLIFAQMKDRSGELQLFVSKGVLGDEPFGRFKDLDLGDWIGAKGVLMSTKTGELSVKVDEFELLSKAVRPLPDKWKGLTDTDTRYRQRYADLIVNEEARRAFEVRHGMISSFRRTLAAKGFIEVETPVLHVEPGGAHARPFITHHNTLDMTLYLRIALELHLKRLIVGGMERVFEIGRIFRNEGISTRHNPEFTMMELYQAFVDYTEIMALTEELIVTSARDTLGHTTVDINGSPHDMASPWRKARMVDLIEEKIGRARRKASPILGHGQVGGGTVRGGGRGRSGRTDVRHRSPSGDLAVGSR